MKINLLMTGVGGQGILTASQILGRLAVRNGVNVLANETHGMAQRGGVVTCQLRYGDVHSPLIPRGEADILAAFEPIEALRHLRGAGEKTYFVVNTARIYPFTVSLGQEKYPRPDRIEAILGELTERLIFLDANELARDAGGEIAANVVMVGAIIGLGILPFSGEQAVDVIGEVVPDYFRDVNIKAFEAGYELVRNSIGQGDRAQ